MTSEGRVVDQVGTRRRGGGKHMASRSQSDGLHPVVTTIVVLGLLGLLGWNIVVVGPEGYPTSVILGGLLGAYAGVDQLLKRKRGSDGETTGRQ